MNTKDFTTYRTRAGTPPVPFETAQDAWFWFISAQEARNDGARYSAGLSLTARPCEPTDILKCLERLYRNRRLVIDHILVLRHYGRRQMPPEAHRRKEARAYALWVEALSRLEETLVAKGIVRERNAFDENFNHLLRNCYSSTTICHEGATI